MSHTHEHEHHGDEHSHTHEHTHSHAHEHEHSHTHEHTHHGGDHGHDHRRAGATEGAGASKDAALLRYMLEHNRSHTQELLDIGRKLADAGFDGVSGLIGGAADHFEHGNSELREALELLDSGASPDRKE